MDTSKIDVKEVLNNLGLVCKDAKLSLDDHMYLQTGLKAIQEKLAELEQLKKPQDKKEE